MTDAPILLDFESRSRCKIKQRGGRWYWRDPSTEALCCVLLDMRDGSVDAWVPGMPAPAIAGRAVGAHNMTGFDRHALAALGWTHGQLIDTSQLARRAGLPGALDALGTRWLGIPKDKAASRFTASLSTPSRAKATRGQLKPITPEIMSRVLDYCASDVAIIGEGWELLEPWLDLEPGVEAVDRVVNDRGIAFDSDLARALLRCADENAERTVDGVSVALGLSPEEVRAIARSPQQFTEFTGAPNAQKETVAELARAGGDAGLMARARQAFATIAAGKLRAGLARVCPDGRLRDMQRYYGAHTGRWSGVGMQLHNLTRPDDEFESWTDDDICRLADAVVGGASATQKQIDLLLRATLTASSGKRLAVCDFTGIESRGLAWASGDDDAIDVMLSGRKNYTVMASTIFGVPYDQVGKGVMYQVGKIAELACGYGMGHKHLYEQFGEKLDAAGVEAVDVVKAWRRQHAPSVHFWYALSDAFVLACEGRTAWAGPFEFVPSDDGRDVAMFLPSGRPVVYSEVEVHRRMVDGRMRADISYLGTKQVRERLYGGKLAENAIQAMCRCLLADAMVRAERAGLPVVLTVHDEIVCEVDAAHAKEAYSELQRIMVELPDWAEGFPVGASGFEGRRYRK